MKRSRPTVVLHANKKCKTGGTVGRTCQEVKFKKIRGQRGEKETHETVLPLISGTHQMANIMLDVGHAAKDRENEKDEDGEGVHVPYYMALSGGNCNHL